MAMVHVPELTFHKIMNYVAENDKSLPEKDLVTKTREKINDILEEYAGRL